MMSRLYLIHCHTIQMFKVPYWQRKSSVLDDMFMKKEMISFLRHGLKWKNRELIGLFQLGIDPQRCHLHGFLKDVNNEYLSSSIFVLPSRFEGFGLVMIEAMASGLPVLSFDCENGPRSIIADGVNGFLVPPFNVDMLSEKMMLLMDDVDLRKDFGLNAYKASLKYNMDHIGLQWKQLFDSLIIKNEV